MDGRGVGMRDDKRRKSTAVREAGESNGSEVRSIRKQNAVRSKKEEKEMRMLCGESKTWRRKQCSEKQDMEENAMHRRVTDD